MEEIHLQLIDQFGPHYLERGALALLMMIVGTQFVRSVLTRFGGRLLGVFRREPSEIGKAVLLNLCDTRIEVTKDNTIRTSRCSVTCASKVMSVTVCGKVIDADLNRTDRKLIRRKYWDVVAEAGRKEIARRKHEVLVDLKKV